MIIDKPLFIFELANNHNGQLEHGLRIIREIKEVCADYDFNFAFKLQYRDLNTFIHPDFAHNKDFKFVKRFSETKLNKKEFKILADEIKKQGFITICSPFDENSVDLIAEHGFDIIKIASCSFTDWSLLEKIATHNKPVIASTAGASLEEIDNVVSFFTHREKEISIMHCVANYPTKPEDIQLNQIDLLKNRYPLIRVGYSTHEEPDNLESIKMAIAKGAGIFEKHVGIKTDTNSFNAYSATPQQVEKWLKTANEAFIACGFQNKRYISSETEKTNLKELRRGVFALKDIKKGENINSSNTFFAIPNFENQILTNDLSKYQEFTAITDIAKNQPIYAYNVKVQNIRGKVESIINKVKDILKEAQIALPHKISFEISHHYGIDNFNESGAVIINCINREYCKKLIVLMPNQRHPSHVHKLKEETFQVLYGDMSININGIENEHKPGDIILVERGATHSFGTKNGVVFEEISTTHFLNDSYYEDESIIENKKRKTKLNYWIENDIGYTDANYSVGC